MSSAGLPSWPEYQERDDEERWVREELGPSGTGVYIEHLDGEPWHDALMPFWWHRCRAQTRGRGVRGELIERCACGAIRFEHIPGWGERNARRRNQWWHDEKWAGLLYLMFAAMLVVLIVLATRYTP